MLLCLALWTGEPEAIPLRLFTSSAMASFKTVRKQSLQPVALWLMQLVRTKLYMHCKVLFQAADF